MIMKFFFIRKDSNISINTPCRQFEKATIRYLTVKLDAKTQFVACTLNQTHPISMNKYQYY